MTQQELAEVLGYKDKSMIAKIEKGCVDLPVSKIMSIASLFGVEPDDLLYEKIADQPKRYDFASVPDTLAEALRMFISLDDAGRMMVVNSIRGVYEHHPREKITNILEAKAFLQLRSESIAAFGGISNLSDDAIMEMATILMNKDRQQ